MQPPMNVDMINLALFQSSPGQKAGWQRSTTAIGAVARNRFNPHPGQKAGCNAPARGSGGASPGFQSSPGQKAGCNNGDQFLAGDTRVSILTRPEGRVQQWRSIFGWRHDGFQSSPGQKAGCNPTPGPWAITKAGFNPHPARRPGATFDGLVGGGRLYSVSILTRPDGRVQRDRMRFLQSSVNTFQSSPGQKAGCNCLTRTAYGMTGGFQSSPGQKAGCNARMPGGTTWIRFRFQSSPGQKAGCNPSRAARLARS